MAMCYSYLDSMLCSTCYPLPTPTYLAKPGCLPVAPSHPTNHKNNYYAAQKQLLKLAHPAAKVVNIRMAVLDWKEKNKHAASPLPGLITCEGYAVD